MEDEAQERPKKKFQLNLSKTEPTPLYLEDLDSGSCWRIGFKRIFTRSQRMMLTKTVKQNGEDRDITDVKRMFREGIAWIQYADINDEIDNGIRMEDEKEILKAMDTPENMGGIPENVTKAIVRYLLGENILPEESGKS